MMNFRCILQSPRICGLAGLGFPVGFSCVMGQIETQKVYATLAVLTFNRSILLWTIEGYLFLEKPGM